MTNYPHNPSGQIADAAWFRDLCQYCSDNDIRLFNDAAYISLSHSDDCATLSEVAVDFPDLSWCEAFTAAKLIGNGTGWHVGAWSVPPFIGDMKEVKTEPMPGSSPHGGQRAGLAGRRSGGIGEYREYAASVLPR